MNVLIKGGTLLPMRGTATAVRGDLLVRGRRIEAIGTVDPPEGFEVLDASGCYVMPGLVQVHVHLVQTLFRGLAEDLPLLEWLQRRIWPLEAALDEASLRAGVRLGLLELIRTGTTTLLDMGTQHGGDIVAEELVRSGIRARFGQAMMDSGEGVPPAMLETTRASLDASAALKKRWDGQDQGRIGYAYAPRFALSCTRELLESVAALAKMTNTIVHTHSNEARDERALIERGTGRSPVAYLAEVGLASERSVFAHGVHLDAGEISILEETKTRIAHCPSSNLKLGSGIARIRALRDAKIIVGLGVDGAACNNALDGFEEARLATLLSRTIDPPGTITAGDALVMATRDGARALRLDADIGTLEIGKRADLVILDGALLAGPSGDAATRIVFGGGSRAVRDVFVDGEALLSRGKPTRLDPLEIRARAQESIPSLIDRATPLGYR